MTEKPGAGKTNNVIRVSFRNRIKEGNAPKEGEYVILEVGLVWKKEWTEQYELSEEELEEIKSGIISQEESDMLNRWDATSFVSEALFKHADTLELEEFNSLNAGEFYVSDITKD